MINLSKKQSVLLLTSIGLSVLSPSIFAKDQRTVVEPKTPQVCKVLLATGTDSTKTIQSALNSCAAGKAVQLASNKAIKSFTSGAITIPSNRSLIINSDVVLKASNNAKAFDNGTNTCGKLAKTGNGCNALITFEKASNSGIYGNGTIDGQGGAKIAGSNSSWWDLAAQAKNSPNKQNAPRLIQINSSNNITLHKVKMTNSPNFHVVFKQSNGLTAWGITIKTPGTARNTDGIDPISSQNVTVAHSNISTGDDNVAIKANPGAGASKNMSFLNNTFGAGHGMSIGSETTDGVYGIDVNGLIMNGTTNGLRIKSDQSASGIVSGVRYEHVTMTNVKKPVVIDTVYENKAGKTKALWSNIFYNDIKTTTAGAIVINGKNASKPIQAEFKGLNLAAGTTWNIVNANIKK
ncbi:glycoside hydrolase family 28 protein [Acinetobacter sp. HY1485]|uniref:glycoside hydrolase family 28 protein n=1 Tax=Acinetobacter sp. HY1485 TaxID=2970918 RepID=UPI0022B94C7F|nr:glycosyl hydrolase family 28 protein [Acinetobacter sp. HY1485]